MIYTFSAGDWGWSVIISWLWPATGHQAKNSVRVCAVSHHIYQHCLHLCSVITFTIFIIPGFKWISDAQLSTESIQDICKSYSIFSLYMSIAIAWQHVCSYLPEWMALWRSILEHAGRDIKYFPFCYGSQIGHPVLVMEEFPWKTAHRLWPGVVVLCIVYIPCWYRGANLLENKVIQQ